LGAFSQDFSLLRHRGCCREQHDDAERKNTLLHNLYSWMNLTDDVVAIASRADRSVSDGDLGSQAPPLTMQAAHVLLKTVSSAGSRIHRMAAGNCDSRADTRIRTTAGSSQIRTTADTIHIRSCCTAGTFRNRSDMAGNSRRTHSTRADTPGERAADERLQRWLR
jgi:hypothetical protein